MKTEWNDDKVKHYMSRAEGNVLLACALMFSDATELADAAKALAASGAAQTEHLARVHAAARKLYLGANPVAGGFVASTEHLSELFDVLNETPPHKQPATENPIATAEYERKAKELDDWNAADAAAEAISQWEETSR